MSRRRRVISIVLGLLIVLYGITMGWASSFLSWRVGNPYSWDKATEIIESMKADGTVFGDEEAARTLLFDTIYKEVDRSGESQSDAYYFVALCGLFFIGFALVPSRRQKLVPVGGPMEPSSAPPGSNTDEP